jgi:predicted O-methyltransferase YrrM
MRGLEFQCLEQSVVEANDIGEIRKLFGWSQTPVLDDPSYSEVEFATDLNLRRLRDAEVIATVMANVGAEQALEIGTSEGRTTALMARSAPDAVVHTVNVPPEEIERGEAGELTTWALDRERIGTHYREQGCENVRQILANTATWQPDIGPIDVAFIDGCHDSEFVYNDTLKVLSIARPGAFILWHDFNLGLTRNYGWIHSVCSGVEALFREGKLRGRVIQLRDSWVGLYRVPADRGGD